MVINNPHNAVISEKDNLIKKRNEIQDRFVEIEKQKQVLVDQKHKAELGISALTDELLRLEGEFRLLEEMAKAEHQSRQEQK